MASLSLSPSLSWLLALCLFLHSSAEFEVVVVTGAPAQAAAPAATPAALPAVGTGASSSVGAAQTALSGTGACPELHTLEPGTVVELKDYSIEREMAIVAPGGKASLGFMSSPVYSYALENELRTATGSLVAKLVSPVVFWDTTADFYDCVNEKFAEIQWATTNWWTNIWNPYARIYEIYDASGTQVATMEKVRVSSQVAGTGIIALKVMSGEIVMQLNLESAPMEKSVLGLFGKFSKVTINAMQTTIAIPPILQDPRFLSLIAAAELAPGNLGPFWTVLFWALSWACIICCCCSVCCGSSSESAPAREVNSEERTRLMGPGESGAKEAAYQAHLQKQRSQGWLNCCSRKVAPSPGGIPPV